MLTSESFTKLFHKNALEPNPDIPHYLNLFIQVEWNVKVEVSDMILRYQVPKVMVNVLILVRTLFRAPTSRI